MSAGGREHIAAQDMRGSERDDDIVAPQPIVLGNPDGICCARASAGILHEKRKGVAFRCALEISDVRDRAAARCDQDVGIGRCDGATGSMRSLTRVDGAKGSQCRKQ
jgi:hypothetical protein